MSTPRLLVKFVVNSFISKQSKLSTCVVFYGLQDGVYMITPKGINNFYCRFCTQCETYQHLDRAASFISEKLIKKFVKNGCEITIYFS